MKATDTPPGTHACPDTETLAAFLAATGSLPPNLAVARQEEAMSLPERRHVAAHIAACDRCVEELRAAQRRLVMSAGIPVAVPAAVAARAAAAAVQRRPSAAFSDWLGGLSGRFTIPLRLPVLVPAVAAVVLLIVFGPRTDRWAPVSREMSRSVPLRQAARVTAESAAVRAEREADAAVIAILRRGAPVVLLREEGGWLRIAMSDGVEGWIERKAFE